jgi:molybdopterin converting factor small subunit
MSKIHIPTPLRQYVGKQSTIDVKAATVGEAMTALVSQHPDLRRHLYTEEGKLRAFVNLYVNDEDIRYLQKEATAVNEGDNISIVPSIAGGALERHSLSLRSLSSPLKSLSSLAKRGTLVSACSTEIL